MNIKKALKILSPETRDAMDSEGTAELHGRIILAAEQMAEVQSARESDENLTLAKDRAKDLAAPYRETLAGLQAVMTYAVHRIGELGGE